MEYCATALCTAPQLLLVLFRASKRSPELCWVVGCKHWLPGSRSLGALPPYPALDTHELRHSIPLGARKLPGPALEGAQEQAGEGRQVGQVQHEELAWLPVEHKPVGAERSPQQGHFYSSFSTKS